MVKLIIYYQIRSSVFARNNKVHVLCLLMILLKKQHSLTAALMRVTTLYHMFLNYGPMCIHVIQISRKHLILNLILGLWNNIIVYNPMLLNKSMKTLEVQSVKGTVQSIASLPIICKKIFFMQCYAVDNIKTVLILFFRARLILQVQECGLFKDIFRVPNSTGLLTSK